MVSYRDTQASCPRPAMKGLHQNVEDVRTGGATLSQAVGSLPNSPIHLPITKATTQESVEGGKGLDQPWTHSHCTQHRKQCPPRQGVEALFNVKAGKPKVSLAPTLKDNDVREELRQMDGARFRPESKGCRTKEGLLQGGAPFHDNTLTPQPIEHLQHRDGTLISRPGSTRSFWNHSHIGIKPFGRPAALHFHHGQQSGDSRHPSIRQTPPNPNRYAKRTRRGTLPHLSQHLPHPVATP